MGFDLGKMYGPLPLGAWIAATAGSLGLAVVLNRTGGAGSEGDEAPEAPATPSPDAIFVVDRSEGAGNVNQPPRKGAFESNNEWRLYVAANLVGRGFEPSTIDGALIRYMRGDDCRLGDQVIISAALGIAFPPDAVPPRPPCPAVVTPTPTTPPTAPKPPVPPPSAPKPPATAPKPPTPPPVAPKPPVVPVPTIPSIRYTIRSGDTLSGIALRFYGLAAHWPSIYYANGAVILAANKAHGYTTNSPDRIWPGTVLVLYNPLNGRKLIRTS